MKTGMHIGTVVDKQSLEPLTDAIMRILDAKADQRTIRKALEVLSVSAEVKNVSISGCTITGDKTYYEAPPTTAPSDDNPDEG